MWHVEGNHFWGMHWMWWSFWIILLIWIFLTPWKIPGQMTKKDSPSDIAKKRYASGEITAEEYEEIKKKLKE